MARKIITSEAQNELSFFPENEEKESGYIARLMVLATMPHSKQRETYYKRKNGNFTLKIVGDPEIGLPYGPIPRLIMSWLTDEVVRKKERKIILGNSLSYYMRELGYTNIKGGKRGNINPVKEQTKRLFLSTISCTYSERERDAGEIMTLVDRYNIWWTTKSEGNQLTLEESTITLSERFFNEIISCPVPINMNTLRTLKGSSMALDIYFWLTYRNGRFMRNAENKNENDDGSDIEKTIKIPMENLQLQIGAGYPLGNRGRINFKANFLKALKKVLSIYPNAGQFEIKKDALMFTFGTPDILP